MIDKQLSFSYYVDDAAKLNRAGVPSKDCGKNSPVVPTAEVGCATVELADAASRYSVWPAPTIIVSDGPYGLAQFPGDPPTSTNLAEWYAPHVAAWARYSLPETTLWFWGTEVGWATVHPLMVLHGWEYRALHVWDKGLGHIAGNVNGRTIRGFPTTTEVCAQYVRDVRLPTDDGRLVPMREWLRLEWLRTGLPLSRTNDACGVKNAATRKYFTQDHLWYFPPAPMMERLAGYASEHGAPTRRPYFSLDGQTPLTATQWERMRAKWTHLHGVTNVWAEPALRGAERIKERNGPPRDRERCFHANQKPLRLLERIIIASSDPGDVVWEPFGGLCSVAVAAVRKGRVCYSAEVNPRYYERAKERLEQEGNEFAKGHSPG